MTIDDDNSIYVGGLPYDSTEDSIRRVFDLYGSVIAVKVSPPLFLLNFLGFLLSLIIRLLFLLLIFKMIDTQSNDRHMNWRWPNGMMSFLSFNHTKPCWNSILDYRFV